MVDEMISKLNQCEESLSSYVQACASAVKEMKNIKKKANVYIDLETPLKYI